MTGIDIYSAKRHFDPSKGEDMSMYDNMPYNLDPNLCNKETIAVHSGNIVKHYKYKPDTSYMLDNKDDLMETKINLVLLEKQRAEESLSMSYEEVATANEEDLGDLLMQDEESVEG